jgi:hypothetical protein
VVPQRRTNREGGGYHVTSTMGSIKRCLNRNWTADSQGIRQARRVRSGVGFTFVSMTRFQQPSGGQEAGLL